MAPDRDVRDLLARQPVIDVAMGENQKIDSHFSGRCHILGSHAGVNQYPCILAFYIQAGAIRKSGIVFTRQIVDIGGNFYHVLLKYPFESKIPVAAQAAGQGSLYAGRVSAVVFNRDSAVSGVRVNVGWFPVRIYGKDGRKTSL